MLNPAIFFSIIWFCQLLGYFVFKHSFGPYATETFFVIATGFICFLLGCFVATTHFTQSIFRRVLPGIDLLALPQKMNLKKITISFCLIYSLVGILLTTFLWRQISGLATEPLETFSQIRGLINADFDQHRLLYNYFRYYQFGIIAVVFLFCLGSELPKYLLGTLFCIGLISVALTTSRLFLLFYILAIMGILFSYRRINSNHILVSFVGFLIAFFGLSILMKKGYENFDQPLALLKWNFQVYMFSPLAAFNSYISSGLPHFDSPVILPNALKKVFNIFGGAFELRTNLMPFVNVPVRTNVYTFFFPLHHDGGKTLVAIGCVLLGFFHQTLYLLATKSLRPILVYLFAISLYPLGLSFFEDAYFSSPGFLLLQISPVIFLIAVNSGRLLKLLKRVTV